MEFFSPIFTSKRSKSPTKKDLPVNNNNNNNNNTTTSPSSSPSLFSKRSKSPTKKDLPVNNNNTTTSSIPTTPALTTSKSLKNKSPQQTHKLTKGKDDMSRSNSSNSENGYRLGLTGDETQEDTDMDMEDMEDDETESLSSPSSSSPSSSGSEDFDDEYTQPLEIGEGKKGKGFQKKLKTASCWALQVDSMANKPTVESTLKCMAMYYAEMIENDLEKPQSSLSELLINSSFLFQNLAYDAKVPTADEIYDFVSPFFMHAGLTPENVVIMMIYIERMAKNSRIVLAPDNWAILMLGSILMTCKVWDDLSVWNVDLCQVFREITLNDMNILERFYLNIMDYNVSVKSSLFAGKFFDLRDFAVKNGSAFDLKALSRSDADHLETQTAKKTLTVMQQYKEDSDFLVLGGIRKSKSENILQSKITPAQVARNRV